VPNHDTPHDHDHLALDHYHHEAMPADDHDDVALDHHHDVPHDHDH
jgi:hypothetical protein